MNQRIFMLMILLLSVSFACAGTDDDTDDEGKGPTVVILFMFFGLALGILVMQFLSFFDETIPYTCIVFLLGVIFSVASSEHDTFGRSIADWVQIDAELVLFVFLPPLIFGEAMSLNWYHVKGAMAQSLLLAGPGVLVGTLIMGVITKFMLPYNWGWNLAMVFGSIVSATDPVSVVSLLKSASASPKLTILIVGESLVNDGTAMILFTLFFNALNGTKYSIASIILYSIAATIGSTALGAIFGGVTVRWLRSANRPLKEIDITIQIAVTICCAYLVFFTAQYTLEISGILACCGAGVVLAWLAPPIILSHETLHNVWGMIEWSLNTLIFLLAGLVIGHRVLGKVSGLDWFLVFVLYIILMIIRVFIITLLYPWLSTIGHKCTKNEAIFMSWAGLRGALGMTLALIVEKNSPDNMNKETSRLFFYVGGIAALTLLINATTANRVLLYLGLLGSDTAEKVLVTNQIKRKLRKRMDKVIDKMAEEFHFTEEDLEEVRMSCTLLTEVNMDALYRDTERMSQMLSDAVLAAELQADEHSTESPLLSANNNNNDDNNNSNNSLSRINTSNSNNSQQQQGEDTAQQSPPPSSPTRRKAKSQSFSLHNSNNIEARLRDGQLAGGLEYRLSRQSRSNTLFHTSSNSPTHYNNNNQQSNTLQSRFERVSRVLSTGGGVGSLSGARKRSDSMSIRAHTMSRMLSMSHRGMNPAEKQELLSYVRAVFLEIVRVRYWHNIEGGKLPRLSHSAQFLLYSIEVGLDQVGFLTGARDWVCIEEELNYKPYVIKLLSLWESIAPVSCTGATASQWIGKIESRNEKRAVYMLTSFIEAHEHAQRKIHNFLSIDDDEEDEEDENENGGIEGGNNSNGGGFNKKNSNSNSIDNLSKLHKAANTPQSPEEARVISESRDAVQKAKLKLNSMSSETVSAIRSKQAARLVLAKEAEMVKNMVQEGLLTPTHAEEFLEEIGHDTAKIEKERNRMYRQQASTKGRRRKAQRKEEVERRSLLFDNSISNYNISNNSNNNNSNNLNKGLLDD